MATAFVLGSLLTATPPAHAEAADTRLVFGRSCDSGPEHQLWFVDDEGNHAMALEHIDLVLGARVSPSDAPDEGGELLAVSTPASGLDLIDYANATEEPAQAGVGPPPLPHGDYATVAWSTPGDRIAYLAEGEDGPAIWIHELDSASEDLLLVALEEGDLVTGLDWSPDESTIIWSTSSDSQTSGTIFSVEVAGGTVDQLGPGDSPRWSPDGARIAFSVDGSMATMDPDGSDVDELGQSGSMPVWSPSGDEIAFVDREAGVSYVGIISLSGGDVSRVFEGTVGCDDVLAVWDWAYTRVPVFVDVPFHHLFFADIEWLTAEGITKGCGPDLYCPDEKVTRGQLAAFLVRALGYTDDGGGDLFVDDDHSIFENNIDKLGAAGVTKGCNPPANDRFCPDALVTRAELAAFLVRALGYTDDGDGDLFVDDDDSIFENDIDKLGTAGVTKGCNPPDNDRFCPSGTVTREQMAAFLHRALGP